jgi:hypothetical protein
LPASGRAATTLALPGYLPAAMLILPLPVARMPLREVLGCAPPPRNGFIFSSAGREYAWRGRLFRMPGGHCSSTFARAHSRDYGPGEILFARARAKSLLRSVRDSGPVRRSALMDWTRNCPVPYTGNRQ